MKLDLNQERERSKIYKFHLEDITGKCIKCINCIKCNVSLFHHRKVYEIKLESRERKY